MTPDAADQGSPVPSRDASETVRAVPPTVRVVCIVGHHKSGGTPLGVLVGTGAGVFYAGELYRFPSSIWEPGDPKRLCSCGLPVLQCPFWTRVRARSEAAGLSAPLKAGQDRYERWSHAARTLAAGATGRRAQSSYANRMVEFARDIAAEAGAGVIVDQSANALRARLYGQATEGVTEVSYIHLVRDGRGFLYSELTASQEIEPVPAWIRLPPVVVARWVWMNIVTMLLCGTRGGRYIRVRYEDLLSRPTETLRRLGQFLGVDYTRVSEALARGEPIPMRHVASANRARLQGSVVLKADERWRAGLARGARILFWLQAGWLALSYGYRPKGVRTP